MARWIKLLDKNPLKQDIYKCLCLEYNKTWKEKYLKWTSEGFQPLNYGDRETWAINMNVTHWLEVEEPELPISEAEKLIIETETFFDDINLEKFINLNNIEIFAVYGNAIEIVITKVHSAILKEMRLIFKSNGIHTNVRKK